MTYEMNTFKNEFWRNLDKLVEESEIVIDRPKGSSHPKYPHFIYRVDYGYLKNTAYIDIASAEGGNEIVKSENVYKWLSADKMPEPQNSKTTLSVLGKEYECVYVRKGVMGYGTPLYVYKTAVGDEIEVDNTGKITYYASAESFSHESRKVEENEALSPEESLTAAKSYLCELFGTAVASRFSSELPDTSTSKVWIHFKPKDNGFGTYATSERITLVLSEDGRLLSYYAYNVSSFENKVLPEDFDDEKIKQIINASLIDSRSVIDLSQKRNLVILPDGRMACSMTFRLVDGETVGAWTSVLIPLE